MSRNSTGLGTDFKSVPPYRSMASDPIEGNNPAGSVKHQPRARYYSRRRGTRSDQTRRHTHRGHQWHAQHTTEESITFSVRLDLPIGTGCLPHGTVCRPTSHAYSGQKHNASCAPRYLCRFPPVTIEFRKATPVDVCRCDTDVALFILRTNPRTNMIGSLDNNGPRFQQ